MMLHKLRSFGFIKTQFRPIPRVRAKFMLCDALLISQLKLMAIAVANMRLLES
jgi:hypothetical protein